MENAGMWTAVSVFIVQLFGFLGVILKNRAQDARIVLLEQHKVDCEERIGTHWPSDVVDLADRMKAIKKATGREDLTFGDAAAVHRQAKKTDHELPVYRPLPE